MCVFFVTDWNSRIIRGIQPTSLKANIMSSKEAVGVLTMLFCVQASGTVLGFVDE
jgi:hypothetical protein